MIILQFLSFFITGMIFIIIDYKNRALRWYSIFMFLCSISVLLIIVEDNILPAVRGKDLIYITSMSVHFMRAISFNLCPYTFTVATIYYSDILKQHQKFLKFVPYTFAVFPIFMFVNYPIFPKYNPPYLVLSLWVVPYGILSNYLIIYSYFKENNPRIKIQKLIIVAIFCPATIISLFVNLILRIFNLNNAWKMNTYVIIPLFFIFLILIIRYGVMGLSLKFEKVRIDGAIKSVTSGSVILNHTIKNEILKISLCMHNIKKSALKTKDFDIILENSFIIDESIEHILGMTSRVQEYFKDLTIVESYVHLDSLISTCLKSLYPFLNEKNISIRSNTLSNIVLLCDKVLIEEVIVNIIKNSIDSLSSNGTIMIDFSQGMKHLVITINDNGCGISKENLKHILDPFFTTKKSNSNFGLGLSYCYNVMQKHSGLIDIQSEENKGTIVKLMFPNSRIINSSQDIRKENVL